MEKKSDLFWLVVVAWLLIMLAVLLTMPASAQDGCSGTEIKQESRGEFGEGHKSGERKARSAQKSVA